MHKKEVKIIKDYKKIGGYRFERMSDPARKATAAQVADAYRTGRRKYSGRKPKGVRIVKSSRGYAVYVR